MGICIVQHHLFSMDSKESFRFDELRNSKLYAVNLRNTFIWLRQFCVMTITFFLVV